ncbi:MAG: hypothetical protein AB1500_07700 [Bacillota bacterium]
MSKSGGPVTPEGRQKALENLMQYSNKPAKRDRHGVHSLTLWQAETQAIASQIKQLLEAEGATWIRESDNVTITCLALCLRRLSRIGEYLQKATLTNKRGQTRPLVHLELQYLTQAEGLANSLGLSPQSRVKLGVELSSIGKNLSETQLNLASLSVEELKQLEAILVKAEGGV